jgi:hypothetical protein
MTPIPLTQEKNNLLYFCKGHYGDDFWPTIEKIYCELYGMDEPCLEGIYHMVYNLWWKLFAAQNFSQRFFEIFQENSLPQNNWKVWGGLFSKSKSPWNSPNQWTDDDVFKARITAMVSSIHLSEIKFWDKLPPEQQFAGLSLITDSSFFSSNQ